MKISEIVLAVMIVFLIAVGVTFVLRTSGSKESSSPKIGTTIEQGGDFQALRRYEDKELGIVCYKVSGHDGIACLNKVQQ